MFALLLCLFLYLCCFLFLFGLSFTLCLFAVFGGRFNGWVYLWMFNLIVWCLPLVGVFWFNCCYWFVVFVCLTFSVLLIAVGCSFVECFVCLFGVRLLVVLFTLLIVFDLLLFTWFGFYCFGGSYLTVFCFSVWMIFAGFV